MSYLALARQWRPRTFAQLMGQDHVSKALTNSLTQERLHHAYLFTGTRGVGKTSVARLLAKALNCERGISAEPCLECDACTAIEEGCFVDLIEIDAASKTRVEDTRELLENVQYATNCGRFKIYLIDEVHMLSQHSFNALLKTLEEPPEHVKFLLATTDPQKLPITVLSRCLQFNLKPLVPEVIAKQLNTIMTEEKRACSEDALKIIAKAARGSMRDALSILDQVLVSADESISIEHVKAVLGYTQHDFAIQLLNALNEQNGAEVINLSRQIASEGGHFNYVLEEMIQYLHQITLHHVLPTGHVLLTPPAEIQALAQQITAEDTQLFYQIALKGAQDMALAPSLDIGFEMTLLRMLAFSPVNAVKLIKPASMKPVVQHPEKITQAEKSIVNHDQTKISEMAKTPEIITPPASPPEETITSSNNSHDSWEEILPKLGLTGMARNAIDNAAFINREGNELNLGVHPGHQTLFTPAVTQRIEQALGLYYKQTIKLNLHSDQPDNASPAKKKQVAQQLRQDNAKTNLETDSFLQELEQKFSAEIIKDTISHKEDGL